VHKRIHETRIGDILESGINTSPSAATVLQNLTYRMSTSKAETNVQRRLSSLPCYIPSRRTFLHNHTPGIEVATNLIYANGDLDIVVKPKGIRIISRSYHT